ALHGAAPHRGEGPARRDAPAPHRRPEAPARPAAGHARAPLADHPRVPREGPGAPAAERERPARRAAEGGGLAPRELRLSCALVDNPALTGRGAVSWTPSSSAAPASTTSRTSP